MLRSALLSLSLGVMLRHPSHEHDDRVGGNGSGTIGGHVTNVQVLCVTNTYEVGGSFNDGKGQPSQSNAVSHGCPPARFRKVNVINTGRQG